MNSFFKRLRGSDRIARASVHFPQVFCPSKRASSTVGAFLAAFGSRLILRDEPRPVVSNGLGLNLKFKAQPADAGGV